MPEFLLTVIYYFVDSWYLLSLYSKYYGNISLTQFSSDTFIIKSETVLFVKFVDYKVSCMFSYCDNLYWRRHDIAEILLKFVLSTNQLINILMTFTVYFFLKDNYQSFKAIESNVEYILFLKQKHSIQYVYDDMATYWNFTPWFDLIVGCLTPMKKKVVHAFSTISKNYT